MYNNTTIQTICVKKLLLMAIRVIVPLLLLLLTLSSMELTDHVTAACSELETSTKTICPANQQIHSSFLRSPKTLGQQQFTKQYSAEFLSKKRYFLLGGNDPPNKGIGNLLLFFPAEFYFAVLSSRSILIADDSLIGQMCKEIMCGFPFLSDLVKVSPTLFASYSLQERVGAEHEKRQRVLSASSFASAKSASLTHHTDPSLNNHQYIHKKDPRAFHKLKTLHAMNFEEYSQDRNNFVKDLIVTASGYDAKSDWWTQSNKSVQCISAITGCAWYDVRCTENFAFQRLILGPFHQSDMTLSYSTAAIHGMNLSLINNIFSFPLKHFPRFDAAIHLRNQFVHFEMEFDPSNSDYQKEVQSWVSSEEAGNIFDLMLSKLKELYWFYNESKRNFTVYIAADNERVKRTFIQKLLNETVNMTRMNIQPVYIQCDHVYHVKNIQKLKSSSHGFGMFNVVFDWIALALSGSLFAWRRESTRAHSTFLSSARRMLNHGNSSIWGNDAAFQLVKTKRGEIAFEHY